MNTNTRDCLGDTEESFADEAEAMTFKIGHVVYLFVNLNTPQPFPTNIHIYYNDRVLLTVPDRVQTISSI